MNVTVKTSKNERIYFVKGDFSAGDEDRFSVAEILLSAGFEKFYVFQ